MLDTQEIKTLIRQELPTILQNDLEMRAFIQNLFSQQFANKAETESRFDRVLDEIRRSREEHNKKWAENQVIINKMLAQLNAGDKQREADNLEQKKRWAEADQRHAAESLESKQRWEESQVAIHQRLERLEEADQRYAAESLELKKHWAETDQRHTAEFLELKKHWAETDQRYAAESLESRKRWEESQAAIHQRLERLEEADQRYAAESLEHKKRWEEADQRHAAESLEHQRRWEENQAAIKQILNRMDALDRRYEGTISALGARWGLHSEQSFRNALKGILESFAPVQVLNVVEYDDEGEVFGRPEQIELDIIIRNGILIVVEIKSSMSRSDMYTLERKARFYEKRHNRRVNQLIVISPMIDDRARKIAETLNIQLYSYAEAAAPNLLG